MFAHFHQHWEAFKASRPGRRFQDVHKRREQSGKAASSGVRKFLMIGLGLALTAAGMFFLVVPGPGTVGVFVGIALIASESLLVARLLDRLEVLLRPLFEWLRRHWMRFSRTQRRVLSGTAAALGGLAAVAFYFYVVR
ncbi:MAG TPA: PGPGW domain-containing protein [Prosthecobacter sp.]